MALILWSCAKSGNRDIQFFKHSALQVCLNLREVDYNVVSDETVFKGEED